MRFAAVQTASLPCSEAAEMALQAAFLLHSFPGLLICI